MKLNFDCSICNQQHFQAIHEHSQTIREWYKTPIAERKTPPSFEWPEMPASISFQAVQESPLYEFVCEKGHEQRAVFDNPKYELLFESGVNSIGDNYYREAIFNFTAALERFYEYSILVMLLTRNQDLTEEQFDNFWRPISKQSERQLGAFLMLHFTLYTKAAPAFDAAFVKRLKLKLDYKADDPVALRNAVTHAGFYPTYNQAVSYGEAVYQYCTTIHLSFPEIGADRQLLQKAQDLTLQRIAREASPHYFMSVGLFLNWTAVKTQHEKGHSLLNKFPLHTA